MVAAGYGVSIFPKAHPTGARGRELHAIEGAEPSAQIVFVYRLADFSRIVRDFVDVAKRLARDRTPADAACDLKGARGPPAP